MRPVYILSQNLILGGTEKAVITLANALLENGVDVTLLVALKSRQLIPVLSEVKIQFLTEIQCDGREKTFQRYVRKIRELQAIKNVVKKIKNATIISSRNEYTTLLSKFGDQSVNKIGQLHNEYTKYMRNDFITRYGNINYFVQLTDELKNEIQSLLITKNKFTKVITIPNFVEYRETPSAAKENIILAVGGFNPVKGFDRLIEIWSMIANDVPAWKLIIVGDGKDYSNIKALVHSKGLTDRVILPGFMENEQVFELMARSKIYAMTSHTEAFSFVLVESMQMEMCPIAFDVRVGPRSMIKNGYNGLLVEDGNNELYAKKLMEIILDSEFRDEMAAAAYKKSLEYVKENVIKLWMEII